MGKAFASVMSGAILLAVGLAQLGHAASVRDQILSGVSYFESSACRLLQVEFNLPVRYVSHYPFEQGTELRIELDAVTMNSDDTKFERKREALKPPEESRDLLSTIIYEGNAVPRPLLTLTFRKSVRFRVGQGEDFRSVVVAIPHPGGSGVCEPIFPESE
jgi:hypothetical protein